MSYSSPDATHANLRARETVNETNDDGWNEDSAKTKAQQAFVAGEIRDALGLQSGDLRLGLDIAANRLKRGAKAEALRIYVALVLCEPMNPEFQVGLANCALLVQENCLALQAASVVIALEPGSARGYFLSGRACLALGHFSEAAEDLREAMRFASESKDMALFQSAESLFRKVGALMAR